MEGTVASGLYSHKQGKIIFFPQWPGLSVRIYEHNSKIVVDNLDGCNYRSAIHFSKYHHRCNWGFVVYPYHKNHAYSLLVDECVH